MLIIHRTFRDRPGTMQFAILLDNTNQRVVVTKWLASDNRVQVLADVGYQREHNDRGRVLTEAVMVARLLSDHPEIAFEAAVADVRARRQADRQQVARRVDARDGDCSACGAPLRLHFDGENRKLPCERVLRNVPA